MKKNLLFLFTFLCSITLLTGCNDDDKENAWKQLFEKGSYKGETLALTYSNAELSGKTVEVGTGEGKTLVLKLKSIIPSEAEAIISGIQVDDLGVFSGSGTTTGGTSLTCSGSIKDGILTVALSDVKMSQSALGGLNGNWALLDTIMRPEDDLLVTAAPLHLNWPAIDNQQSPNAEYTSFSVSTLGSHLLSEFLNKINFHEDGNITAKYYTKMPFDETDAPMWIMTKLIIDNTINIGHTEWLDSPKNNLAFWYTKNDKVYIILNIEMIMKQVGSKSTAPTGNTSIADILKMLEELGIDITKIDPVVISQVMDWFTTGIPLNYTISDKGDLKIFADKKMAEPFMPILISMLPSLQAKLDEIAQSNESIKLLTSLLGVEKLTDFGTIWNNNTASFEFGIELKK